HLIITNIANMTGFITNYIQNTAMGMLSSGITAAGNVAGNAVGGVGTMIQSSGQAVGNGIEGSIKNWGDYINSYGDRAVAATAPNPGTATAVKKPKPSQHQQKEQVLFQNKRLSRQQRKSPSRSCIKAKDIGCKHAILRRSRKETRSLYCIQAESRGQRQSHPSANGLTKPSTPKPSTSSLPPVVSKPLSSVSSVPGKAKVSAASKPKTSGGLPRAPVDGLPKPPGVSGIKKAPVVGGEWIAQGLGDFVAAC
ncbi:unnamed protein product, partial [Aureobasidium pullulans]